MKPRPGDLFRHATFLDPYWKPGPGERYADAPRAVCQVTAVRKGQVFYTYADHPGRGFHVDLDGWPHKHEPLPPTD